MSNNSNQEENKNLDIINEDNGEFTVVSFRNYFILQHHSLFNYNSLQKNLAKKNISHKILKDFKPPINLEKGSCPAVKVPVQKPKNRK